MCVRVFVPFFWSPGGQKIDLSPGGQTFFVGDSGGFDDVVE